MILKWGIAGAGKISNDFAYAMKNLSSDEHQLIAVAARNKERGDTFSKVHAVPSVYYSYEELAANPNIGE